MIDITKLPLSIVHKLKDFVTPVSFEVDNKSKHSPYELKRVAATIFGELSNKGDVNEAKTILSTILNRAKEKNLSLQEVISQPKQYKAYRGSQYNYFMKGDLDYSSKQKANLVQSVLDEYTSGNFTPSQDKFFIHSPSGKFTPSLKANILPTK